MGLDGEREHLNHNGHMEITTVFVPGLNQYDIV
jgi:hypothetical protein